MYKKKIEDKLNKLRLKYKKHKELRGVIKRQARALQIALEVHEKKYGRKLI